MLRLWSGGDDDGLQRREGGSVGGSAEGGIFKSYQRMLLEGGWFMAVVSLSIFGVLLHSHAT